MVGATRGMLGIEAYSAYNIIYFRLTTLGPAFRARDTVLGRTVLVRDVYERFRGDPVVRAHLLKQARAAAAVSHPNVATLFEVGEGPDELFLVFEFVPGQTLDGAQGGQPLGVRQTVALGVQLADALGAGHAKGVLHLDVRPSTIKLSRRGHAKLLDLGLGTWAAPTPLSTSGSSDEAAGGAGGDSYQSSEQRGGDPLDGRSDLFSLGLVLNEMLTDRAPVGADGHQTAPRPSEVNTEMPPELDAIVGRATALRAADRYQSAAPMAAELRSLAAILDVRSGDQEPPTHIAVAAPESGQRFARNPWLVVAAAVAALAAAVWFWLSQRG